jgi:hypothetical protein
VDQGRQEGGEDDAAELPPLPVQRGAAVAERDRLQPGQPVAADRCVGGTGGVELTRVGEKIKRREEADTDRCAGDRLNKRPFSGFGITRTGGWGGLSSGRRPGQG